MAGRLKEEIGKRGAFESLEQEAFLNVQRTADALMGGMAEALRPSGLSPTQYNVLRILRGAGEGGLSCREVGERMITRDPDVTRLLDRMEQRGLVRRDRSAADRRVIMAFLTPAGRKLVGSLDGVVGELHVRQLGHLGKARLTALVGLLEAAREAGPVAG